VTTGTAPDRAAGHSLEDLAALLPRYVKPLPRYTSYPTAVDWSDAFGEDALRERLGCVDGDVSIYAHVPFCRSLCHFCACNRVVTRDPERPERYLTSLAREISRVRRDLPAGVGAAQLHLGGGTPTHLTPAQLRRLVGMVADAFPIRRDADVSIEIDPRVTTDDHVAAIAECGFDRVSLGIQDFDPQVQDAIHRIQPIGPTRALVSKLRSMGISGIGFDLIYGLPFQRRASFERTLDTVIELAPDRIALYSYAHVTEVARQQRSFERKDLPGPELKLELFTLALRRLLSAGYVYVGLDHFARPGDPLARALADGTLHRNFMGHTTSAGQALIAFGPSAISELPGAFAQNLRDVDEWAERIDAGHLATFRGCELSEDDEERRFVISRILCRGSLDAGEYTRRFGRRFANRFAPELERLAALEEDGLLLTDADGGFELSLCGRVLARNVAAVFDAYRAAADAPARPRFSQSV
jgi:oxygen-independent coproporphyrinogen-3 oxidase